MRFTTLLLCNGNIQSLYVTKRRHMLFGHVARLDATTPAHQILKQVIAVKSGYQPDAAWRRAPGRPRNSWIMQIGNGSPLSIRREWKKAQDHGHHGESSQRTSAVFASWWWWWMETPTGQGVTNYVRGQTTVNSNSPNPSLPKIRLNAFYQSTVELLTIHRRINTMSIFE